MDHRGRAFAVPGAPRSALMRTAHLLDRGLNATPVAGLVLVSLPRMLAVTAAFAQTQAGLLSSLTRGKAVGAGLLGGLRLAALAIPLTGLTTMVARMIRRRRPRRS